MIQTLKLSPWRFKVHSLTTLAQDVTLSDILQFCCSAAKSRLTLGNIMDCSMPGSSVLYCLLKFGQIHVHQVGDAICTFHSLPSPSPFAFNLSQHQGNESALIWRADNDSGLRIRCPKYWRFTLVLPMNIQSWFPLGLTGVISLLSKRFSRVSFSTTIQKHQFIGFQSLWLNLHICTWLLEKS